MVSLMELLSLMVDEHGAGDGWSHYQDSKTRTITPGNMEHLGPFKYPGWLRHLVLVANNRYTRIDHTIWEKPRVYTPYGLYNDGNIAPGPTGIPWLQTYLVDDEKYKIMWEPVPPLEFLKDSDIWVTAPSTNLATGDTITTSTTITLTWHIIYIFNRRRFLKRMHEVLGEEKVKIPIVTGKPLEIAYKHEEEILEELRQIRRSLDNLRVPAPKSLLEEARERARRRL